MNITQHRLVMLLTVDIAVDLDSGFRCENLTVRCLWPITEVFQRKIRWVKVQLRFCVWDNKVVICGVLRGYNCA